MANLMLQLAILNDLGW